MNRCFTYTLLLVLGFLLAHPAIGMQGNSKSCSLCNGADDVEFVSIEKANTKNQQLRCKACCDLLIPDAASKEAYCFTPLSIDCNCPVCFDPIILEQIRLMPCCSTYTSAKIICESCLNKWKASKLGSVTAKCPLCTQNVSIDTTIQLTDTIIPHITQIKEAAGDNKPKQENPVDNPIIDNKPKSKPKKPASFPFTIVKPLKYASIALAGISSCAVLAAIFTKVHDSRTINTLEKDMKRIKDNVLSFNFDSKDPKDHIKPLAELHNILTIANRINNKELRHQFMAAITDFDTALMAARTKIESSYYYSAPDHFAQKEQELVGALEAAMANLQSVITEVKKSSSFTLVDSASIGFGALIAGAGLWYAYNAQATKKFGLF